MITVSTVEIAAALNLSHSRAVQLVKDLPSYRYAAVPARRGSQTKMFPLNAVSDALIAAGMPDAVRKLSDFIALARAVLS